MAPGSRIQPPNQPASYRLRSRQPTNPSFDPQMPTPQQQHQPSSSVKKQIPLPQVVAPVAPVSHLPPHPAPSPPVSAGHDKEKPGNEPNSAPINKPAAGMYVGGACGCGFVPNCNPIYCLSAYQVVANLRLGCTQVGLFLTTEEVNSLETLLLCKCSSLTKFHRIIAAFLLFSHCSGHLTFKYPIS